MQRYCAAIVRGLGKAWPPVGWTLWAVLLIIPFIPFIGPILYPVYLGARLLLAAWMLIDLASQDVITTFVGSAVLFVFVALIVQPGGLFFIIAWLVYWNAYRKPL